MILTEPRDNAVRAAAPKLKTGRKWSPAEAAQDEKTALKYRDIVDIVQRGKEQMWPKGRY